MNYDDPTLAAMLKRFAKEVMPQMQDSAISLAIIGKPDAKLCLEIGAAVLFDKPIIIAVRKGDPVPANIKRVASAIIELDRDNLESPITQQQIQDAITQVLTHDARVRKGKPDEPTG